MTRTDSMNLIWYRDIVSNQVMLKKNYTYTKLSTEKNVS